MAKQESKRHGKRRKEDHPVEIPMTDLGWSEDGSERNESLDTEDRHAAGTPGGGTASGGLAGTNVGNGDPENVDLEDALGSGLRDTSGEDEGGPPYSGRAGGAVGGTPAEKRAKGGRRGDRLSPGGPHRGDSTIGSSPETKD
jgi:hypothetical protein